METTILFSVEQIYKQTKRILDYPTFRNSRVLSSFLEFVVDQTINKRELHIKEYSIAVNVLQRPTDFNPHEDAVVRIHAGRLRRALSDYYLTKGIYDPIIIDIPKGSYIPDFLPGNLPVPGQELPELRPEVWKPVVAVLPFRCSSENEGICEFASVLGSQLSAELSRFREITVIGYYTMEITKKIKENIIEAGKILGASYLVTGDLRYYSEQVHIRVNLVIASTGEVILTRSFEGSAELEGLFRIQGEIISNVISSIGGYYGLIFQEMAKACPTTFDKNAAVCQGISAYYKFHQSYSKKDYYEVLALIKSLATSNPDHAELWAILGELYLSGISMRMKTIDDPLVVGYECALKAIKLDPHSQQAWHSLSYVHLLKKEKEECYRAALECIGLNANNILLVSKASFFLICAGYFDEGFRIMERSAKLNARYPGWINEGFCFYYLHKKEYADALKWAEKLKAEKTVWAQVLKAVSLSLMGRIQEAKLPVLKLLEKEPEISSEICAMISSLVLTEELAGQIVTGLEIAGFKRC